MPNRIIKETICSSEKIDQLGADAECFFYRLIVNCDDFGLLDARPAILKSKCYPLKSIDSKRLQMMLAALAEAGLVELYSVEGRPYLHIKKWDRHQQIRAKRAKYPMPSERDEITCNQLISDDSNCTRNPIQYNPIQSNLKDVKSPRRDENVACVFDHWRIRMNHPDAKLDDKRNRVIKNALSRYSVENVIEAIDGCARSKWHMGENDRGRVYDDIGLILRDAAHIDGFIKTNRTTQETANAQHQRPAATTAKRNADISSAIQNLGRKFELGDASGSTGIQSDALISPEPIFEHVPDRGGREQSVPLLGDWDFGEAVNCADDRGGNPTSNTH